MRPDIQRPAGHRDTASPAAPGCRAPAPAASRPTRSPRSSPPLNAISRRVSAKRRSAISTRRGSSSTSAVDGPARIALRRPLRRRASATTSIGWSTASAPARSPPSPKVTASARSRRSRRRSTSCWRSRPSSRRRRPRRRTTAAVRADLEATQHDIPIPLNERVLAYIELFQGRLRNLPADGAWSAARSTCR